MGRLRDAWRVLTASNKSSSQMSEWRKLAEFLGIDKDMDEDAASEATYFACMKILSESIAKMPCKLMLRTPKEGVITARGHPLFSIVADRPNKFMPAVTFWSAVEQNRNQYGNAYVFIKNYGTKTTLWILPSKDVEVWYDDACRFDKVRDIWYLWSTPEGIMKFRSDEILHFRTSNTLDGIMGISVEEQLRSTIRSNVRGQRMVDRLYDSDMTSKAVVQYTGQLSDKSTQAFLKGLEMYMSGEYRNEGVEHLIPIPPGSTLTPLNMNLHDSQFLELRKYTAIQIASAFGIKPYQIGDYGKESYSSQEAQQLAFFKETLLYIVEQYEQEITYKLLTDEEREKGYFFKFNIASIMRADMLTQIQALTAAVGNFVYTPNEAREYLDLPSKEGGDNLIGNGSTIPLSMVGNQYTN